MFFFVVHLYKLIEFMTFRFDTTFFPKFFIVFYFITALLYLNLVNFDLPFSITIIER